MIVISRIFSEGFRIFFLSACVFALVAMGVWEVFLYLQAEGGTPQFPPAMVPQHWHAHEMIFGYAGAVLAGFLMTAVPNWTGSEGQKTPPVRFLSVAFALWLLGRLAIWESALLPPVTVAVADLAFIPVLAAKIAAPLIRRPKPQQLVFLVALGLFWLANLACHLEWTGAIDDGVVPGLRAGLMMLVTMILILGGRVTPGFTRNAMVQAGRTEGLPRNPPQLAFAATGPAMALVLAILLGAPSWVLAVLALAAGVAALARLALWQGRWTLSRPILWTMHLSYAFAGLGLIAFAAAQVNLLTEIAALHLLGIGAVGGMTLSILSRATFGHTGRPLVAPAPVALAYVLMPLATIIRFVAGESAAFNSAGTLIAGALWLAAFALALFTLWPAFRDPRLPRRPVGRPPEMSPR